MKTTTDPKLSLRVWTNLLAGLRKAPEKDCSCRLQINGNYLCSKDWNWSTYDNELEIQSIRADELELWKETCSNDTYGPHNVKVWG